MYNRLRQIGRKIGVGPWLWRLIERRRRGQAVILFWHRFSGSEAHATTALDELLGQLRARNIPILTMGDLINSPETFAECAPVVFTIDDGYADFASHAAPVFEKHDSRATVFLTTEFVDGTQWMWWDRIGYALQETDRTDPVIMNIPDPMTIVPGIDVPQTAHEFATGISYLTPPEREAHTQRLIELLEVPMPEHPTDGFGPMNWDTVRELEARGFEFGPHTLTHPILSTVETTGELQEEITGSWKRLQEELSNPVPVFCVPNGSPPSYGDRERAALADSPLNHAVTTTPDYARVTDLIGTDRFDIPRFPPSSDWRQSMVTVYGYRDLQRRLRGAF